MSDSRPFNFAQMYGRLGNWPGTLGPQAAQALLAEIAKLPKGSSVVEIRFDGGRTSAVIGWGCKAGGHVGIVTGAPTENGMSEVWFNRLWTLFEFDKVLFREFEPKPYAVDMIVVNAGYQVSEEWKRALKPGGKIFYAAEVRVEEKRDRQEGSAEQAERIKRQAIENVVEGPWAAKYRPKVEPRQGTDQGGNALPAGQDNADRRVGEKDKVRPEPGGESQKAARDRQAAADGDKLARKDPGSDPRRARKDLQEALVAADLDRERNGADPAPVGPDGPAADHQEQHAADQEGPVARQNGDGPCGDGPDGGNIQDVSQKGAV